MHRLLLNRSTQQKRHTKAQKASAMLPRIKKGLGYEYEAKAARAEANYREAKAAYDKLTRSLPDQTRAEVAKVRIELEKAVNNFYAADPKAIDANTMELLRYIANRGRNVSGKPYMDAFDSLADTLDRSLRRTYLIPKWDELTANIREIF